ncbi:MAG TPA: gluconate 2-dehydrogenase subunit 3 family protein, partial [Vicinamibacteria bacterium]|nr:gluconate 2-dehydrogenase subunit 3 family protein [Vicinamibacteria bacterium]
MNERMGRRQALRSLGASALAPFLPRLHPSLPPQEGEWKPRVLQAGEVETVAALADRIVPETDTPGARQALVHQYIDFVLSTGEASAAERFREELRRLDRKCAEEVGGPFATLESARQ